MKKFLVKFIDAISGQTREQTVQGDNAVSVQEDCIVRLGRVISVLLI